MKRLKTIISQPGRSFVIKLLVVGLLVSSGASRNAEIQLRQTEVPVPTSFRPAQSVVRNHALTTFPGQLVAGDLSKQNRVKLSVTYSGLAAGEVVAPAAIVRQRLVTTDQSVLYLSFRLSRPGGRAPPAFA